MKNKKGFTLVELLAVIAILAILVIIALPNVLNMFNNAKKDLFLTEAKTLFKETSNKFITSSMSGNSSKNIYCKSSSDENNPLDVTTNNTYYYIETNSTGNITKFVVWNDSNYIVKQTGDDIKITSLDTVSVDESFKDIKCSDTNILEKLGVTSKLNGSYTLSTDSGLYSGKSRLSISLKSSSNEYEFDKVKYVVYRKITKASSGNVDNNFVNIKEVTLDNKSENFAFSFIDTDYDNTCSSAEYKIEAYTLSNIKIGETSTDYNYCFVAGTKVKTENGFKNIEDIKVGEKVYSYNLDNNELELKTVINVIVSSTLDTYKMTIGGKVVEMSPRHELYIIDKGWVRAFNVKVGDWMLSSDNEKIEITNIEYIKYDEPIKTYNFTVDGNSNYFVTDIQVLVHNIPSASCD